MTLTEWKQTLPPEIAEHFEVIDGRLVEKDVALVPHGRMIVDLILRLGAQAPGLTLTTDVRVVFSDPKVSGKRHLTRWTPARSALRRTSAS